MDSKFTEYMKNRTVADIMCEYGEQKDEWETVLFVKDNRVVQFKHSNGRRFFCVDYKDEYGDILLTDTVLAELAQQTMEQQMEHFYITDADTKLCDCDGAERLIVKGRVLVGVITAENTVLLAGGGVLQYRKGD